MIDAYRELLIRLNHDELFKRFINEIVLPARPVVPQHTPEKDNTDTWKAKSAAQRGFDLCLSKFRMEVQDDGRE